MGDVQVDSSKLSGPERMAISGLSGIVKRIVLMGARDMPDPMAAVEAELATVPQSRAVVLAHVAAGYVIQKYPHEFAAWDLLRRVGADPVAAREVAVFRAGQPGGVPPEAERRRALLADEPA